MIIDEVPVKSLTGTRSIPRELDFSGSATLFIAGCAPARMDSGFWRRAVEVDNSAALP